MPMKITLFILQKGHEFQVRCGIGWTRVDQEWTRADQSGLRRTREALEGLGGLGLAKFNSKLSKMHLDFKNMPQQYMLSQGDRVLESGPKKIKTTHLNKRHMRLQFIDCNQNLKVYLELVLVWPPRPPKAALVCPSPPQAALGHPQPTLFHI